MFRGGIGVGLGSLGGGCHRELGELCNLLEGCIFSKDGVDKWRWILREDERFLGRDLRKWVDEKVFVDNKRRVEML